jgi:hypothetical protein
MNKKSGKAGTLVPPSSPKTAHEADHPDAGTMAAIKAEQIKLKVGKFGTQKFKPFKPPAENDIQEKKPTWIEIKLVDEEGQPIPGVRYRVKLPDGTVVEGTLDQKGYARIDGFEPGQCEVTFPDLDETTLKEG